MYSHLTTEELIKSAEELIKSFNDDDNEVVGTLKEFEAHCTKLINERSSQANEMKKNNFNSHQVQS